MPSAPRSYLYVPGNQPAVLAKSLERGADALIVDLEDSVAPKDKAAARETVIHWLDSFAEHRLHVAAPEVWVRVNAGPELDLDLEAFGARRDLAGLCAAKTESVDSIATIASRLDAQRSPSALMPLLESAASIFAATEIARVPRVSRLQIGEVDLAIDVGIDPSPFAEELAWARSRVVFASAAAGISAPVAAVSTNFTDLELLVNTTNRLRCMGFFGRACIHPAQIRSANETFTVTYDAAERARRLLAQADDSGLAVFVSSDGRMVDEAVLRAARRTLAQARRS